jgi:hypothetical protein
LHLGHVGWSDFDSAGAATNDISPHAAFHNRFPGSDFSRVLIFRFNHSIGNDFLFAYMNLGAFLSGKGGTNPGHFIILEGTLSLSPPEPQLVKLGDELFGLDSQFFC